MEWKGLGGIRREETERGDVIVRKVRWRKEDAECGSFSRLCI